MLDSLLKHNSFEAYTQEHYEVAYLRFCEYWDIGKLVALADWKSLIGVISRRVQTYAVNRMVMTSLTCFALRRIWKIIRALYRAK
jgi:hypothetical protein